MATLYVDEFSNVATVGQNLGPAFTPGQAPLTPSVASQTVAIQGSSTQSNPFNAKTNLVRLHCDAICSVAFGSNPTAVTTQCRLAANQTEYFGVIPGQIVAVITNS